MWRLKANNSVKLFCKTGVYQVIIWNSCDMFIYFIIIIKCTFSLYWDGVVWCNPSSWEAINCFIDSQHHDYLCNGDIRSPSDSRHDIDLICMEFTIFSRAPRNIQSNLTGMGKCITWSHLEWRYSHHKREKQETYVHISWDILHTWCCVVYLLVPQSPISWKPRPSRLMEISCRVTQAWINMITDHLITTWITNVT